MSRSADYDALRRLDQIERTAHRVRPVNVGEWRTATARTHGPADAVVIAPADLRWLLEGLRAYVTPPGVQS